MAASRRILPTLVARARLSRLRSPVPPSPQPNGRGARHAVTARMHDVDAGLKLDARVGSAVPEETERARGAALEHPFACGAEAEVTEGPHPLAVVRDESVENLAAERNPDFMITRVRLGHYHEDRAPQAVDVAIRGDAHDERRLRGACLVAHTGKQ